MTPIPLAQWPVNPISQTSQPVSSAVPSSQKGSGYSDLATQLTDLRSAKERRMRRLTAGGVDAARPRCRRGEWGRFRRHSSGRERTGDPWGMGGWGCFRWKKKRKVGLSLGLSLYRVFFTSWVLYISSLYNMSSLYHVLFMPCSCYIKLFHVLSISNFLHVAFSSCHTLVTFFFFTCITFYLFSLRQVLSTSWSLHIISSIPLTKHHKVDITFIPKLWKRATMHNNLHHSNVNRTSIHNTPTDTLPHPVPREKEKHVRPSGDFMTTLWLPSDQEDWRPREWSRKLMEKMYEWCWLITQCDD